MWTVQASRARPLRGTAASWREVLHTVDDSLGSDVRGQSVDAGDHGRSQAGERSDRSRGNESTRNGVLHHRQSLFFSQEGAHVLKHLLIPLLRNVVVHTDREPLLTSIEHEGGGRPESRQCAQASALLDLAQSGQLFLAHCDERMSRAKSVESLSSLS